MSNTRTYAYPVCDRGKPFPSPEASAPEAKPKTNAKKSRFTPKAEEKQRDAERDRDE